MSHFSVSCHAVGFDKCFGYGFEISPSEISVSAPTQRSQTVLNLAQRWGGKCILLATCLIGISITLDNAQNVLSKAFSGSFSLAEVGTTETHLLTTSEKEDNSKSGVKTP